MAFLGIDDIHVILCNVTDVAGRLWEGQKTVNWSAVDPCRRRLDFAVPQTILRRCRPLFIVFFNPTFDGAWKALLSLKQRIAALKIHQFSRVLRTSAYVFVACALLACIVEDSAHGLAPKVRCQRLHYLHYLGEDNHTRRAVRFPLTDISSLEMDKFILAVFWIIKSRALLKRLTLAFCCWFR